jgi:hypothetical protein
VVWTFKSDDGIKKLVQFFVWGGGGNLVEALKTVIEVKRLYRTGFRESL